MPIPTREELIEEILMFVKYGLQEGRLKTLLYSIRLIKSFIRHHV
jgi:hypothetical protein